MAKSIYEYVKAFEQPQHLLLNCWIVIRIDGRGFGKFTKDHGFIKPMDERGQLLMNHCARHVLSGFQGDVILATGHSDEFSFILRPETTLWSRRADKLTSQAASMFTGAFILGWPQFFETKLLRAPIFDARAVLYPTTQTIRDYISWRQVDCHINHLYNAAFWALVQQGGMSESSAHQRLSGTSSAEKHELLFGQFQINYNDQPSLFKRPSVLFRATVEKTSVNPNNGQSRVTTKSAVLSWDNDLIQDQPFWTKYFPHLVLDSSSASSSSSPSPPASSPSSSSSSSSSPSITSSKRPRPDSQSPEDAGSSAHQQPL